MKHEIQVTTTVKERRIKEKTKKKIEEEKQEMQRPRNLKKLRQMQGRVYIKNCKKNSKNREEQNDIQPI